MVVLERLRHMAAFGRSPLGLLVDPFYLARRALFRMVSEQAHHVRGAVLDVGCGSKPYRELFACQSYTGVEVVVDAKGGDLPDCYYDGKTLPFANAHFDSVVCNQVLEHVFDPDNFLGGRRRITNQGGTLLLTVPFAWNEHEQPWDYARYSSFGLKHLLAQNGFELQGQYKTLGGIGVCFQLMNAYLFELLHSRSRVLNLLVLLTLMVPVTVLGLVLGTLLPRSDSLYLDNVIVASKREKTDD